MYGDYEINLDLPESRATRKHRKGINGLDILDRSTYSDRLFSSAAPGGEAPSRLGGRREC